MKAYSFFCVFLFVSCLYSGGNTNWDREKLEQQSKTLLAHQVLRWAHDGTAPYYRLIERIDPEMLGNLAQKGNIYCGLAYISVLAQSEDSQGVMHWLNKVEQQLAEKIELKKNDTKKIFQLAWRAFNETRAFERVKMLADKQKAGAMLGLGGFLSLFGFNENKAIQERVQCMKLSIKYLSSVCGLGVLSEKGKVAVRACIDKVQKELNGLKHKEDAYRQGIGKEDQEKKEFIIVPIEAEENMAVNKNGEHKALEEMSLADLFKLGKSYYEGNQRNYVLALESLQKVADADSDNNQEKEIIAQAALLVGELFARGRKTGGKKKKKVVIEQDYSKAEHYYEKAIALDSNAWYQKALLYYTNGRYKDAGQAFMQMTRLGTDTQKKAYSYWYVGTMLLLGQECPINKKDALGGFKIAQACIGVSSSFDFFAQVTSGKVFHLLDCYVSQLVSKKSIGEEDLDWCYIAGRLFGEATGTVAENRYEKGIAWLAHAADNGHLHAQWHLGSSETDAVSLCNKLMYLKAILESDLQADDPIKKGAGDILRLYAQKGYIRPLWYLMQAFGIDKLPNAVTSFSKENVTNYDRDDWRLFEEVERASFYNELISKAEKNPHLALFLCRLHIARTQNEDDMAKRIEYYKLGLKFLERAGFCQPDNQALKAYTADRWRHLGCSYANRHQDNEAVKALDRAIKLGNIAAKASKAGFYLNIPHLDKQSEGRKLLQEALDANDAEAFFTAGMYFFDGGSYEQGVALMKKAVEQEHQEAQSVLQTIEKHKPFFQARELGCLEHEAAKEVCTLLDRAAGGADSLVVVSEFFSQAVALGLNAAMARDPRVAKRIQQLQEKINRLAGKQDEEEINHFNKMVLEKLGVKIIN